MTLSIGLDVGTTAIKAAAYDAAGRVVAHSDVPSKVMRQADGTHEQDPHEVWHATAACLSALAAQIDPASITSLGICAQGEALMILGATAVVAMLRDELIPRTSPMADCRLHQFI